MSDQACRAQKARISTFDLNFKWAYVYRLGFALTFINFLDFL